MIGLILPVVKTNLRMGEEKEKGAERRVKERRCTLAYRRSVTGNYRTRIKLFQCRVVTGLNTH